MRATFENYGTIVDVGNIVFGGLDTSGNFGGAITPNTVGLAVYQRKLDDQSIVEYKAGFHMKPSEARAMASAILSAATEAKS